MPSLPSPDASVIPDADHGSCKAIGPTTRDAIAARCDDAASARNSRGANTPHGSGLGETRWVVERTVSWLHQFRRLRTCYEKTGEMHDAFLQLAVTMLCWNLHDWWF